MRGFYLKNLCRRQPYEFKVENVQPKLFLDIKIKIILTCLYPLLYLQTQCSGLMRDFSISSIDNGIIECTVLVAAMLVYCKLPRIKCLIQLKACFTRGAFGYKTLEFMPPPHPRCIVRSIHLSNSLVPFIFRKFITVCFLSL